MRCREIKDIYEGVEDKGLFKAVFFAGLPGAGKSTIASRITDGAVSPRHVNTDRSYEFLLKKFGQEATPAAWAMLGKQSQSINSEALLNYLNGMLPLFIDGTSANPIASNNRADIAEQIGYDIAMVWVNIDFDTAMQRMQGRERKVDKEFVEHVYNVISDNKAGYQQRFGSNFIEVDNSGDNFTEMEGKVFNIMNRFFQSPIQNPTGTRIVEKLRGSSEKYLVPTITTQEQLQQMVNSWYNS